VIRRFTLCWLGAVLLLPAATVLIGTVARWIGPSRPLTRVAVVVLLAAAVVGTVLASEAVMGVRGGAKLTVATILGVAMGCAIVALPFIAAPLQTAKASFALGHALGSLGGALVEWACVGSVLAVGALVGAIATRIKEPAPS